MPTHKISLAAALLLAGTATANAADVYTPIIQTTPPVTTFAATDWSGAYLGAFGGYNFGRVSEGGNSLNMDGFVLGGFAGYNVQQSDFVFGIEGDIGYSFVDDREATAAVDQGAFGSLRGRIGYDLHPVLIYATAGAAASRFEVSDPPDTASNTHIGWTAGVGADIALTDTVFGRIEYRYTDYGSRDYDYGGAVETLKFTENTIRAGIGFKF